MDSDSAHGRTVQVDNTALMLRVGAVLVKHSAIAIAEVEDAAARVHRSAKTARILVMQLEHDVNGAVTHEGDLRRR